MQVNIVNKPEVCPVCGSKLEHRINNDGNISTDIYCVNKHCKGILRAHLKYIISKNCFDIQDLGEHTIDLLLESKLIDNWYDIFELSTNDLIDIVGMTPYSAEKLHYNINNAREHSTADVLLLSLGIPNMGILTCQKVLKLCGSLDMIFNYVNDENNHNVLVKSIGDVTTNNLINALTIEEIKDNINYFINSGFNLSLNIVQIEKISNCLEGLKMLASGTFKDYSRDDIKKKIEMYGGVYASGVNKKLDILVCGDNVGPSKLEKAKKLGIKIISEEEFNKMLK